MVKSEPRMLEKDGTSTNDSQREGNEATSSHNEVVELGWVELMK